MELSLDEQRLIAAYRALNQAGRDDALSYLTARARHADSDCSKQGCQCSVKSGPTRPETAKTPIFTE